MKTQLLKLIIAISFFMNVALIFGQNTSGDLNNLHVKLMQMDNKFYLFLTDSMSNPYFTSNFTGEGKTTGQDGKKKKITLTYFGETAFVLNLNDANFKSIKVILHYRSSQHEEYIYATFLNNKEEGNSFQCPMHPDEMLNISGKCPKCGLGLIAKKVIIYHPPKIIRKGDLN